MLLECANADAAVAFKILEMQPERSKDPGPPTEQPDWCVCLNCRPMPTQQERKCCGQCHENCKSGAPGFDIIVLDRQVLRVAMAHRNDLLAEDNLRPNAPVEEVNKTYCHAAYRQYILLHHGKLGIGNRRVVPSCCVWKIRDTFPDPNNVYVGWLPSTFD